MMHIRHHPRSNTVSVGEGDPGGRRVVPVVDSYKLDLERNPVAASVYYGVLYRARYARDRRAGIRNVSYCLVHPDPWLVAIAMVMWEGIVQGLSWETVKLSVRKAMSVMQAAGVAPTESSKTRKRGKTEVGFAWTGYLNGKKQYDMFVGLRRVHDQQVEKRSRRR